MKKFSLLILLGVFLFVGCGEKDEKLYLSTQEDSASFNEHSVFELPDSIVFAVEENTLVFENVDEFDKLIDYLDDLGDSYFDAFEEFANYRSYRTEYSNEKPINEYNHKIEDELFATIINPNREIVIGGFLFQVDFEKEKTQVFVLNPADDVNLKSSSNKGTFYADLNWDDGVNQLFEGNESVLKRKRACKNSKDKEKNFGMPGEEIKAKVCFQRFTFYNSIIIKFKAQKLPGMGGDYFKASYKTVGNTYYKRYKGGSKTRTFSRANSGFFRKNQDEISHRPYQSSKRLRSFNVEVVFELQRISEKGSEHPVNSEKLQISCSTSGR